MRSVILIPARLNSTRLPGKALLEIGGIPMVVRVMLQAKKCPDVKDVFVCTDSNEIAECVEKFSGKIIMTSQLHQNGTTRIAEAKAKLPNYDLYIDIQGDEPFINPKHISLVIECYKKYLPDIVLPLLPSKDSSISTVKVVRDVKGLAMYMSRANIPFNFSKERDYFFKHLSIIAFSPSALNRFASLPISALEQIEGIELLRALENQMQIQTLLVDGESFSIDTPADYEKAKKLFINSTKRYKKNI